MLLQPRLQQNEFSIRVVPDPPFRVLVMQYIQCCGSGRGWFTRLFRIPVLSAQPCGSTVDLNTVNLVFSGTGAICCLISTVIIVLILSSKAVLQRLFLYLMASILLRELFIVASLEHHYKYDEEIQDKVCTVIGLIWNWSGIMVFIFTVGMKVYLFIYVKRLTRGDTGPVFVQSGCGRVILESLYVVLSVFVTICYALVPFFTKNYGLAGPWCWIRAIDENCTVSTSGLHDKPDFEWLCLLCAWKHHWTCLVDWHCSLVLPSSQHSWQ